ncbi:UNVERIFIED_CONTAM: protein SGT1 [Sesamum latifolium]|uniref:Protein SGT1 n=1 Tax=Sesamum latifolium TaxID=2727402 RepID=A0AAW2T7C3_9LAMI
MACFKLEEYQTAKMALETAASLAPGDSRFTNLIKECDERIAEEAAELPKQSVDKAQTNGITQNNLPPVVGLSTQGTSTTLSSTRPRYRHEFYQKPEEVVVTIFAKSIPANSVVVDFGEQIVSGARSFSTALLFLQFDCCLNALALIATPSYPWFGVQLSVTIELPGEEAYHFQPRLFGKVMYKMQLLD